MHVSRPKARNNAKKKRPNQLLPLASFTSCLTLAGLSFNIRPMCQRLQGKPVLVSGEAYTIAPIRSVTWYHTLAIVLNVRAGASNLDPNATLAAFIVAVAEGDMLGAQDAALYLACWLGSGGFEPNWTHNQKDAFLVFMTEVETIDAN